jgi:hypothetical protein
MVASLCGMCGQYQLSDRNCDGTTINFDQELTLNLLGSKKE